MTTMPVQLAGLWPPPTSIDMLAGFTQLELTSYLVIDRRLGEIYRWVSRTLEDCLRIELEISYSEIPLGAGVALCFDESVPVGGYRLRIDHQVVIEASTRRGIALGLQTLRQVVGPSAFRAHGGWGEPSIIPNAVIVDVPVIRDRAVGIDVTHRAVPVPVLLRWLDLLAGYKITAMKLQWAASECPYSADDLLELSGFAGARSMWLEADPSGSGVDSPAQWTFRVPQGCIAASEAELLQGARAFAAMAWTGAAIDPAKHVRALAADDERCRAAHIEPTTVTALDTVTVIDERGVGKLADGAR